MIRAVGKPEISYGGPRIQLWTEARLQPCTRTFYGYSAEKTISMIGQYDSVIKHEENESKVQFVVA